MIAGCDGFHGVCRPSIPRRPDRVLARIPLWLARDPRRRAALERRAGVRTQQAGIRASQPPLARAQPPLRPVPPGRGRRRVVGRQDLGRAAAAARARGLDPRAGRGARQGRHRHAELRRGADAIRPPLPRGRRRAHRAPNGRKGTESGAPRRAPPRRSARVLVSNRPLRAPRRVLGGVPSPRLASRALLLVDDVDAPPLELDDDFALKLQLAQLRYVTTSEAAATSLAENYVGVERA